MSMLCKLCNIDTLHYPGVIRIGGEWLYTLLVEIQLGCTQVPDITLLSYKIFCPYQEPSSIPFRIVILLFQMP